MWFHPQGDETEKKAGVILDRALLHTALLEIVSKIKERKKNKHSI